jgi:outer membrane receptor protein involved in Fe transport
MNRKMLRRRRTATLLNSTGIAFMASMVSLSAHAQETPQNQPATAEKAPAGLEEIVVTARRRSEGLQDVPATVTAITSAELQRRDLSSIERVAAATPQLAIGRTTNGSGASIVLRGIGSSAGSSGIEQSVALIVDGVYYGQGSSINDALVDASRIEVLKGPQALFFGKNATAGVISVVTNDPGPNTEVMMRGGYEFAAREVYGEAVYSTPITDTLGIRIAGRASKMYGGYFENVAPASKILTQDIVNGDITVHDADPAARHSPGTRQLMGRITLKWDPTDSTSLTVKGSATDSRNNNPGWNQVVIACQDYGGVVPTTPQHACRREFKLYQNNIPAQIAQGFPGAGSSGKLYQQFSAYTGTATLSHDTGWATLTSINNIQHQRMDQLVDYDYNYSLDGLNVAFGTQPTRYTAYSTENRIQTSFDGPINLMVAVLYQHTKYFTGGSIFLAPVENSSNPENRYVTYSKSSHTTGETISPYGQILFKPTPEIELTGGVRYIHETKDSDYSQPYVNPALAGIFLADQTIQAAQKFTRFLPEFTAKWSVTPTVNLFAAYKTGYKSGGFSGSNILSIATQPSDFVFGPESAKGFEVGLKSELLGRSLRFNVTAYRFNYSGLQLDFFDSPNSTFRTLNGGKSRSEGIEAEFEYVPRFAEGLTLRGNANYNNARFIDFQGPCYSGQRSSEGCTIVGPFGVPFQDLSGQPLLNAPKWTGSLGLDYQHDLSRALTGRFSVNARYSARYYPSELGKSLVDGEPILDQPAFVMLDAGIGIGASDDRWELMLIGKNLTNRFVITGSNDLTFTGSGTGTPTGLAAARNGYAQPPRTVQLQATVRF